MVSLEVRRSGPYTETVERTVRIDSAAGIAAHAESWLGFSEDRSKLEVIEAWVETPSGERRAVPSSRILLREGAQDGVEVGSRLHLRWRAEHAPVFPGHFVWQRHAAATGVPVQWVVRLSHEPGLPLRVHRPGLAGGELAADARGWRRHEYRLAGAEPAPVLALSTFTSWAELAHRYRDFVAPMATVTPAIRAQAQELTRGARNTAERVRRLHDWVQHHIRYVALTSERGGWSPFPADQVLHNRDGDCQDQSVLLQALLAAVGIDAETVLIDGERLDLPPLPNHFVFSHAMVCVPAIGQYLDPANREPMGVLVRDYVNKPALHTSSGRIGRTPASSPKRDGSLANIKMAMRPDGSVHGSSFSRVSGHERWNLRHDLADHAESGGFVGRVLATHGEWGSGTVDVVSGPEDLALEVEMLFNLEPVADLAGPTLLRLPRGTPASLLRRYLLPLDPGTQPCHGERHIEVVSLRLPPGRKIEGPLPPAVNFTRGVFAYHSSYEVVREGGPTRLDVVRERYVHCTARRLSDEDRAHREALRALLARDLWAQVTVR